MKPSFSLNLPPLASPRSRAFSLVEVTIALGIFAFALVSVVALLPIGLDAQRQAVDQAFAAQVLNDVSQALQGVYRTPPPDSVLRFPSPLANIDAAPGTVELPFYEDGSVKSGLSTDPKVRGRVVIDKKAPVGSQRPVHVTVAWGRTAVWETSEKKWNNAQGSLHTFLYIAPR